VKKNVEWLAAATKVAYSGAEPMAGGPRRGLTIHNEGVARRCDGGAHVVVLARYANGQRIPYHLIWCPVCGRFAQCIAFGKAARSMKGGDVDGRGNSANKSGTVNIQVCVAGMANSPLTNTPMKGVEVLGELCDAWGIPHTIRSKWGPGSPRDRAKWMAGGIQGHCHGPNDDHTDMPLDPAKLKAALWPEKKAEKAAAVKKAPAKKAAAKKAAARIASSGKPDDIKPLRYPGGDRIKAMRRSDKPNDIAGRLQRFLAAAGCYDGPLDRVWSLKLKQAVKCFQSKKNLTPDGIPGPATWKAMGWPVPFQGSGHPDYPYIWFRPGVNIPPNKDFLRRLNAVGKEGYEKHGRRLVMVSGYRPCGSPSDSPYKSPATQWSLSNGWTRRLPGFNLAARPCTSNHGRSNAADVGWENRDGGGYVSYALAGSWTIALLKKHGLRLPMWPPWAGRIEAWHVEPA
jgi:hypothetical protein